MGAMELSKVTSKTSSIKALLLRAWRERWSDLQWGIHIKTILPRGVSGDVYNLADCILQQALVGLGPNHLVLSYLRHSLSSQLISYAALLQHISKYHSFHKPHCILSLLELLDTSQVGTTCRGRTEEGILATSMLSIVLWLLECYQHSLLASISPLYDEIQNKCVSLLASMLATNFTTTMLYLAKHEDKELYNDVVKKCKELQNVKLEEGKEKSAELETVLEHLMKIELRAGVEVESVTYCLQPLLSVEISMNPCAETPYLVNKLLMLQRLKGYSNSRLYCEVMRACFMSLINVLKTSEESQWGAFTYLKLPYIFKSMHQAIKDESGNDGGPSEDIVAAFDLLLQLRPLLDIVDTKGDVNFVECLLTEFHKINLITAEQQAAINKKREQISEGMIKAPDITLSQQSIPRVIVRAEPTLPRLLRSFDTDNIKMESLLGMLGQALTGKSFELIIVVATKDWKLRTFVQKLIKTNETYKHGPPGENPKQAQTRAMLFDITFLMLCSIVNQYGSQCVLGEDAGDSFFEMWVRECMVEKGHPKPPESIINLADPTQFDALLQQFNSNEDFKYSQLKWDQMCLSAPGVIKDVLLAWEEDVLTNNDVLRILDAMRSSVCCLPVCATAWLCSYMQILHQDGLLKPMNMVQQFLAPMPPDDTNDNFKMERFAFMSQIIRRMQHNIHPVTTSKMSLQYGIIASTPISTQLETVWNKIHKQGWVNMEATHLLQSLFATGGPCWFITNVLKEVLKYRYQEELTRAVDLAFGIFHMDIENCTLSLLLQVLPQYLHNRLHCDELVEPQLSALAKLCVYCIFSAAQTPPKSTTSSKRSRVKMEAEDNDVLYPASKLLKVSQSDAAVGFGSTTSGSKSSIMSPSLQAAFNQLFNAFLVISNREGEISEQTHFVYKFLETMVQCGGERTRLVLEGQPLDCLMPNLIRWLPDMLSVELIAGLYDVTSASGRRAAARDLCMLTNLQASPFYK